MALLVKIYRFVFARAFFYRPNRLLYRLSLSGLGILNYETEKVSGEASFRLLPDGIVSIKSYIPAFCEIYAYRNIVAILKRAQ